jgi:hypothetical protein
VFGRPEYLHVGESGVATEADLPNMALFGKIAAVPTALNFICSMHPPWAKTHGYNTGRADGTGISSNSCNP